MAKASGIQIWSFSRQEVIKFLKGFENKLLFDENFVEIYQCFKDRERASTLLSEYVNKVIQKLNINKNNVAVQIIKKLSINFDLIICRKIQIPWNPEVGYGAVTPDGTYVLNEELVKYLGFTKYEIEDHVKKTLQEIKKMWRSFSI